MDIMIQKLKDNKTDALNQIIEKYSPYVYTVVRNFSGRTLSEQDIEEVVCDVFILLWKNRENIHSESPIVPYLAVIAKNCVKKQTKNIEKRRFLLF